MSWQVQMRNDCLERLQAGLQWLAVRRGRVARRTACSPGDWHDGEDAAFYYLRRKGYTVVARRWSSGDVPGDVDLIAWEGPMLCFVEVKTRTARDCRSCRGCRRLAQAQHVASAGPPVRAPVAAGDGATGTLRRGQRLPCAGAEEAIRAL